MFAQRLVVLACVALTACAVESAAPAGEAPLPGDDAGSPPPAAAGGETIAVAHDRELRGAWVSTVFNGTWPSRTGLAPAAAQAELVAIFDALASARMNAVFLQIRPESDALYASAIEPWSRFLTGTQGRDPGWDPLAFAIEKAHERGLELHAWINPYRGMTSATVTTAANHVTKALAADTVQYGNQLWMDPGATPVRMHILDVVRDVLARYDIDGLHFDDYFYPYPIQGETFDDAATYAAYTNGGGGLTRDDWRRSNVDTLVRETGALVAQMKPDVRFGVSPFGIYRPGIPAGITGLDAYAAIYCDPVKWIDQGWVDYLVPQLYWPTTRTQQAFGKLVTWWASLAKNGRTIFVGHDATKIGDADWPLSELEEQVTLSRAARPGVLGNVFFTAKPLVTDELGLRTAYATKHWTRPAATPRLPLAKDPVPEPPRVVVGDGKVTVEAAGTVRSIAIYRLDRPEPALERLVAPGATISLDPGRWTLSVVDRAGRESRGQVATVPPPK